MIVTILPYFAIYSEPLCVTSASIGGEGSQYRYLNVLLSYIPGAPGVLQKLHISLYGVVYYSKTK